jgi:hypothetical protein
MLVGRPSLTAFSWRARRPAPPGYFHIRRRILSFLSRSQAPAWERHWQPKLCLGTSINQKIFNLSDFLAKRSFSSGRGPKQGLGKQKKILKSVRDKSGRVSTAPLSFPEGRGSGVFSVLFLKVSGLPEIWLEVPGGIAQGGQGPAAPPGAHPGAHYPWRPLHRQGPWPGGGGQ